MNLKIVFENNYITLTHFDKEYEFLEYLNSCNTTLILNTDDYYADTYDVITVYSGEKFGIGLSYDWQGLQPNLLFFSDQQKIICSFGNKIVGIDFEMKNIIFRHTLNSIIVSIRHISKRHLIVIIHEMGVMVIHETGKIIWSCGGTDVIQEYKINDDSVYILCEDGYDVTFSILDGRPI